MKKNIPTIVLAIIAAIAVIFCFVINGQKADLKKQVDDLTANVTKLTADLDAAKSEAAAAAQAAEEALQAAKDEAAKAVEEAAAAAEEALQAVKDEAAKAIEEATKARESASTSFKFEEPHKITVEVYNRYNDGGSDPTSSPFAQYIINGMKERYNVDVELVSVGRWTETDDINNLLAAQNAPDVCVTYSYPTILNYADMDAIIDLNPYLEEYKDLLPNFWSLLGDYNIYYDQDPETKTVWAVEALLSNNARINTFIRKDWLDKLGLELPTTT